MRVAYLTNQYPHTSHSFIRREIAALETHGMQVERISVRRSDAELVDPSDRQEAGRTHVILAGGALGLSGDVLVRALTSPARFWAGLKLTWKIGRSGDRGFLRHLVYLAEACHVARRLRRLGIRHVHAHFGTNPAAVVTLCNAVSGIDYSFTVHGPEEFDRPTALRLDEKIARASMVVGISQYTRSQMYRWCRYQDWKKINVIHCGVDASFLGDPAKLTPVPDVRRFVCVGRLSEQKGQLLLVRAAAELLAEGVDLELVLVGDGPMRQEIESLIDDAGVGKAIRITGWQSGQQVRQHMLGCRAMVLPSFAEGLPVVIMEALALGRPVISTYVAGIPELVEPQKTGWLVPAGSVEALKSAMREALSSPVDELSRMGRNGAQSVAEQHDVQREAAKLAELFKTLPHRHAAAVPARRESIATSSIIRTEVRHG